MAIQTGKFPFTGKLGNMIGYKSNGKYYMRSVSGKTSQTKATKKAAKDFGIASTKGRLIRQALKPHLDVIFKGTYVNQLTGKLRKADLMSLKGFRFNSKTGINKYFHLWPVLSEKNILQIPEQSIPGIFKHTLLEVKVIATKIDFAAKKIINTISRAVRINSEEPFAGLQFNVKIPGKGSLIVALQVRGLFEDGKPSHDKRWSVADLVAVVPQDVQQGKKKRSTNQQTPATQKRKRA